MNQKIRNKWYIGILCVVIFITLPILLNFILLISSFVPEQWIIGTPKDWLAFWSVYLGAAGTLLMAYAAFRTIRQNDAIVNQNKILIKQNSNQLTELKRQWEEDHRPLINLSIIIYRQSFYIKIKNIGKENATDIKISFNKDFIERLPKEKFKEMYMNVEKRPFIIESGEAKYLFIGFCEDIRKEWENKNVTVSVAGTYCSKYDINYTFNMDDFITQRFMSVKDALWEIADGLSCPNKDHYPIQQSLDIIARHTKISP